MGSIEDFLMEDVFGDPKRRICLDFDGVIHKYSKGFITERIYDEPTPGTKEALEELSKEYELVLFSARINTYKGAKEEIIEWLKKYDLLKYFFLITDRKIPAFCYIDDSAITFKGSWNDTLNEIKNFKPWYKETNEYKMEHNK